MPSTEGLTPVVITDFAPGLWNVSDWIMPAKGWQQMQDCYPQAQGGLRAFFKSTKNQSTSGITSLSTERVLGLAQESGLRGRSGGGIASDRYLSTYDWDGSTATPRVYRRDGTNGATSWTELDVSTGGILPSNNDNGPGKTSFQLFTIANGNDHMLMVLRANDNASAGLWRVNYSSVPGTLLSLNVIDFGVLSGALTIHEARIIVTQGNQLVWSLPKTEDFTGDGGSDDNFLPLDPRDGDRIAAVHGIEPSDLLVLRQGAGFVVVQGDIASNPSVQATNEGIGGGGEGFTDFGLTPYGLVFISNDGYLFLTDGRTHTKLSEQLTKFGQSSNYAAYPDIRYIGDFLFVRNKVYDFRTKSWFTQTQLAGSSKSVDLFNNEIWGTLADGTNFEFRTLSMETGTDRVSTYTAQTAPLHGTDGRNVNVRLVDIAVRSYDNNATIAVTVNGHTVTRLIRTAGKQNVRFLFNEHAEVQDVTFVSTAGNAANEAPSFDSVTVWTRPGHLAPN